MGFLSGKRILITGIANKQSIAWGIAQAMHKQKAILGFTYENNRLRIRVEECAKIVGSEIILPCDVSNDTSIKDFFCKLSEFWNKFDGFVHSIAFAPSDQFVGDYVNNVTREGFKIAQEISSYSFVAMARESRSMINKGGSLLTLSYLGSERAVPFYNVMGPAKASLEANVRYMAHALGPDGIRVNAISAGPIRTLAASAIKNFRKMLAEYTPRTALHRNVSIEDIGNTAAFLVSELALGITGEVIHVDGGFNIAF
ncbi:enoyl-ACP reductase FabI [Candidatus Ishikawella capsulata]|uniref:Enoyl-[acyl-carrier-protein] reductase [NADH] n=1 Tax=Candidatus Ishikawaella capsulata Mpkobe TaxID=476281 RepID=C5WC93_9ENTR|nr:SDR family oxidoreductase [Candidatus Ishikawaella capsulata]BAH82949.1 enoyl-(acyl carrier protein) reductase [Candidatus Ishikawaella capsulata Mpkobe]